MPVIDPREDLIRLASIKAAQDALAAEKQMIEARLIDTLDAKGVVSVSTDIDGESIKGALVRASRIVIDEGKLRKNLDTKQWNKVTSRVLDKEKLEAAIAMDIVDAQTVAAASEEKMNKPYVKVSGKVPAAMLPEARVEAGVVNIVDVHGSLKPAARRRVKPAKPRVG